MNDGMSSPFVKHNERLIMKKLIALALVAVGISLSARAQWIVYDPTMNIQQIIDQAANIAKYVQMIENQVQQIQTLTDQLNEFKHYEDLFGDPKAVLLSNLFRDQLDRYGEMEALADEWAKTVAARAGRTALVLNADDPLIADLGRDADERPREGVVYFGIEDASQALPELQDRR